MSRTRRSTKSTTPPAPARSTARENFESLVWAVGLMLLVRIFILQAFRIPSGSMIPTLLIGDWLFVNKLAYGPAIPFTNKHLPGYAQPKRGDVVVFVSPYQPDNGADPTPVAGCALPDGGRNAAYFLPFTCALSASVDKPLEPHLLPAG